MSANRLDPLDQFEVMTTDQKIERLMTICLDQQIVIDGLKEQQATTRGVVSRLKTVVEEAAALAVLRWNQG